MERDVMEFDVLIVGAGPSGLATAIRLKQLAAEQGNELSVCVLEKGSEVGAHILSGAVFETRALDELIPDWHAKGAPLETPAGDEQFLFLTPEKGFALPAALLPKTLRNHGNYIISLGNLCRWLAAQAEELGVEVYPGFAAAEVLYNEEGAVVGVATGDMGIGKDGQPTANHAPGVELRAKQTVFAEGCRGSLSKTVISRFGLDRDVQPQTYGIGIKEIWEIDPAKAKPGFITHTIGWPLDGETYGGSFMYHLNNNQVVVGFVVGLDYTNPHLSPFEEFQRFKTHPKIRSTFEGGRRVCYGARSLIEGGFQAIPKLTFPGGVLVGDAAGFMNVAKIKGSHTAMKSGIVAAEAVFEAVVSGHTDEVTAYGDRLKQSWLWSELRAVRNVRPAYAHYGLFLGSLMAGLDLHLLHGKMPWTLSTHTDHDRLRKAADAPRIAYPKPDGVLTFDRLSSVFISNTNHEENQPPHLKLADADIPIAVNLALYDAPEQRYCPAGVYEIVGDDKPRLQINAQNCVHCKTCDIKDPLQNITWTVPEGGGGPNYPNM